MGARANALERSHGDTSDITHLVIPVFEIAKLQKLSAYSKKSPKIKVVEEL
jgi:hypothetical protein